MPIPGVDGVSHRVRLPAVLTRGRASVSRMETRLGADLVAPTSGTYTLYSSTGSTVYTGTVTIASSIATITVPALSLPSTLALGDGYREVWALTYSGGSVYDATRPAILARYAVHCPVTQADLHNEYPDIASQINATPTTLQGFIDAAWEDVVRRLLSEGKWPEQIVDVETLVEPVRELAFAKFFRFYSVSSPGTERYSALSDLHANTYRTSWASVRYRPDIDGDGNADGTQRIGAQGIIRMNAPSFYDYRTTGRGRVL